MRQLFILLSFILMSQLHAQTDSLGLPYYQIPEYPADFQSGNVLSRMIDGLGYRYYWASEGLREEDLAYKPSELGQTPLEVLDHLHGLSIMILNATAQKPNIRPVDRPTLSYEEMRKRTLHNFKSASELCLGKSDAEVAEIKIIFQRGDKISEFPLWNLINGPIADAIYHTGQIVSYRRTTGNPMNPKVSVFSGKNRE